MTEVNVLTSGSKVSSPTWVDPQKKMPPAPFTVTEALEALLEKQNEIKAALDVLISDATTLRSQM